MLSISLGLFIYSFLFKNFQIMHYYLVAGKHLSKTDTWANFNSYYYDHDPLSFHSLFFVLLTMRLKDFKN